MNTCIEFRATITIPDVHLSDGLASLPWLLNAATRSILTTAQENIRLHREVAGQININAECMEGVITLLSSYGPSLVLEDK